MSIDSSPTGNKERKVSPHSGWYVIKEMSTLLSDYCSEINPSGIKRKDKQYKLYRLNHGGPAFAQATFF